MNNIPPDVIYIYTVYNLKSIGKNVRFFYKKTYRVILQPIILLKKLDLF